MRLFKHSLVMVDTRRNEETVVIHGPRWFVRLAARVDNWILSGIPDFPVHYEARKDQP